MSGCGTCAIRIERTALPGGRAPRQREVLHDIRAPTGNVMITMPGAIAEFECDLLLERQREGVATVRAEGNTEIGSPRHVPKPLRGSGSMRKAGSADMR